MNTPACYNREPFTDPNAGWEKTIRERAVVSWGWDGVKVTCDKSAGKPVMRYRWPWFTDRCEAWNPGPGHVRDTVPAREGWMCDGCKWLPAHARAWIRGEDGE